MSIFGLGPWAEIVIWPNFNTVDPMSKFSDFLKAYLSNDVKKSVSNCRSPNL